MMEKAGYIQRIRGMAVDHDGTAHDFVELHIHGGRYAIRRADLVKALAGRVFVQVEELTRHWNYYLGATCGLAQVSASGKALNIDLFSSGSFTISLAALREVLYGKERYGIIVRIPENTGVRIRRIENGQQRIGASV